MSIEIQRPHTVPAPTSNPPRAVVRALARGLRLKCPKCGRGRLFRRYLKVADRCGHCAEALHHHRADDAPPYFTILLLGHLLVPLVITVERAFRPPLWVHAALWLPLTLTVGALALASIKGAIVGLQWALYMHNFDAHGADSDPGA